MELWHITWAGDGRQTVFLDEATVRACVRSLARPVGERVLLFCLVDNHLHLVIGGTRGEAANIARGTSLALRPLVATPLEPSRPRRVESRGHLRWLVNHLLGQPSRHRLPVHPALWSGSCFLDLVGARVVRGLSPSIWSWLPRLRLRECFGVVGIPARPLPPADVQLVKRLGAFRVAEAAAAAVGVGPGFHGNLTPIAAGRAAAIALCFRAGMPPSTVAEAVGVTRRAVYRLARKDAAPTTVDAIRIRLSLEETVAATVQTRPAAQEHAP